MREREQKWAAGTVYAFMNDALSVQIWFLYSFYTYKYSAAASQNALMCVCTLEDYYIDSE